MSDSSRDRIEGTLDDVKGHGKSAAGDLTGDREMQGEGEWDQGKGGLKQGMADAKDKVDDAVKNLTDRS